MKTLLLTASLILYLGMSLTGQTFAKSSDDPAINDEPLREALSLPEWFKLSFLDIPEDIKEANRGRRGLIIYFGQSYCPYCKALLNNNWGRKDIVSYTRANFDVIAINVRGDSLVTDIDGKQYSEKVFAARHKATFTPTVMFIDDRGQHALTLTGYRPPYQFRAALEYVADKHFRQENFRSYLARAEGAHSFGQDILNENNIFTSPPYDLAKLKNSGPLAVFFEERRCHACDVLHANPLVRPTILEQLKYMKSVQLDMWSSSPLVTPTGKRTTARQWADELALDYAPTLIFFDESGEEIIRVESVVGFFRLQNVLQFINTRAYRQQPNYQLWRTEKSKQKYQTR